MTDPGASQVPCQHLHVCSGCPAMGMSYPQQLEFKRARVTRPLSRYAVLAPVQVDQVIGSDLQLEYRTRAKLMVAPDASVGLFARDRDHRVVDLPGCRILTPAIAAVVAAVRTDLSAGTLGLAAGRELLAIDVREADSGDDAGVLLTLVIRRDRRPSEPRLRELGERILARYPAVRGVAVNLRAARSIQVLGSETIPIAGQGVIQDRIGSTYHHATFGAFTQVNRLQAARIHEMVASAIESSGGLHGVRVLELYGGAGALGLGLARRGASVEMVESFEPAVERANQAAAEQGLSGRYRARAGDAAEAMRELAASGARYDVVLANPPRRGVSRVTRAGMATVGARAIGYVSCDPDTLARDIADLSVLGYRVARIRPLDMIPQTDEVESFAWLQRGDPPAPSLLVDGPRVAAYDRAPNEDLGSPRWKSVTAHARVMGKLEPDASGAVLLARSSGDSMDVIAAAAEPEASETFVLLCVGRVAERGMRGGGTWRRLMTIGGHSLVKVRRAGLGGEPIAASFAAAGMRVVGDREHGHKPTNTFFEERHGLDRAFAHRWEVELAPGTLGALWRARSPLAGDLVTTLVRLGGEKLLAHPALAQLVKRG